MRVYPFFFSVFFFFWFFFRGERETAKKKEKRWDEYEKRWRKGEDEDGKQRWRGLKKRGGGRVHTVERKGKRETENKTAKQQRMERKN